ncbi:type II CAAX endopeptidase family protein [Aliiroseovarius sp.]|uniref:CPBP family intramembrane glutamic endopeptidase n=1 Tax=Aliiroseovarius sp. TaxID=1872442 RepID=UPI00261C3139|nr:type II CAAX endopeptidase family protein [Aliiroseovarius sp.]
MTQPPFWQPALARPQLWRTLLGLVLTWAIFALVAMGLIIVMVAVFGLTRQGIALAATPTTALMIFLPFLGLHIGLALVLPLLHRRGYRSLFGPSLRLNLRHFRHGMAAIGVLALAGFLVTGLEQILWPGAPEIVQLRPLGEWLLWLPLVIPVVFMQSLAEELVFRGYLLGQLRARFRSLWIAAVLPSALFGVLHFAPATWGVNAYMYVLNTTLVGVIACMVTLRTGNLGAAAGLHFANNLLALVMGVKGEMAGLTLFALVVTPKSGYMTWSFTVVIVLSVGIFIAWWRWMDRKTPEPGAG